MDIQYAHAIAPGATKLLVLAKSDNFLDLFAAVSYAKKHADYVSMSWGTTEFSSQSEYDSVFFETGVTFFRYSKLVCC
jgi:subtilase family serine protease